MAEVTYITPPEGPISYGEWNVGNGKMKERLMYGAYKVKLDDGFTFLTAHSAFVGTVSMIPLPIDDPEVRESLIRMAEEARESATTSATEPTQPRVTEP